MPLYDQSTEEEILHDKFLAIFWKSDNGQAGQVRPLILGVFHRQVLKGSHAPIREQIWESAKTSKTLFLQQASFGDVIIISGAKRKRVQ